MEPLRDESTGVFSWEAFQQFGSLSVNQAVRRNGPFGLLIIRLDDCPSLEEDGTLQVQHAALMVLAGVLQRSIRAGDFIGQHGPRSFGLLAGDAHQAGALRFAERIRALLPERLTVMGAPTSFRISTGIAALPQAGSTFEELLQSAQQALASAVANGGNMDWLSGVTWRTLSATREPEPTPGAVSQSAFQVAEITMRRRQSLEDANAAIDRGESNGIALRAGPGACPVCVDAARDIYQPSMMPTLPLIGCTSQGGCRCVYSLPTQDPRQHAPPVMPDTYNHLEIPRRLHDAARFGSHGRGGCRVEDLADYLDAYPLLPFDADLDLQANEVAFLKREARRARELPGAPSLAVHGPSIPLEGTLRAAVEGVGRVITLPEPAHTSKGNLYITNWRILFRTGRDTESMLLVDVAGIECFRDGIACLIGDREERIFFILRDPVQVALVLSRAVRATVPALV